MSSSNSTVKNNAATLEEKDDHNNKVQYSTIEIIDNFESLSGIEDNDESETFKNINPDADSPNGVYWLESNVTANKKQVLLFEHNDIFTSKPPRCHISKLIKQKFGPRTQKINDQDYCSAICERHESIRLNFLNNVRASVEDIMTNVAMKIGMRDGKARFTFIDIARHVLTRPTWESICRLNYVLRGAFEYHRNWKLNFESNFMKRFNYVYLHQFSSQGKQHGCFVKIISDVISNKIRDVNSRLKKHLGISLTIRNSDSGSENARRMIPNNKSFFGIKKNVKIHLDSDAYKKNLSKKSNKLDYSFPAPSSLRHFLNVDGEIEYNILEGVVFPVRSLLAVNHAITSWIADTIPANTTNNILPLETNTIVNTEHIDVNKTNIVQTENDQKSRIKEVTKYDVEKEKDEEAEILEKRRKIRRMVARDFEKKV